MKVQGPTEEEILQEVMKRSEEEYKEAQRRRSVQDEEYNETVEKMIAQSAQEAERLVAFWFLARLAQQFQCAESGTQSVCKHSSLHT